MNVIELYIYIYYIYIFYHNNATLNCFWYCNYGISLLLIIVYKKLKIKEIIEIDKNLNYKINNQFLIWYYYLDWYLVLL